MTEFDGRFKRLADAPDIVVVNNYKCGFSSSNLLRYHDVTELGSEDTVIFFYRDVVLRAVSVFINWCITDERYATGDSWLLDNLRRHRGDDAHRAFLQLFDRSRHDEAFAIYAAALDAIASWNEHTRPQVEILRTYDIDAGRIDHFVELERSAEFTRLTGLDFPYDRTNESDGEVKRSLIRLLIDEPSLPAELERVYRADREFFAEHGLTTVRWQDLGRATTR